MQSSVTGELSLDEVQSGGFGEVPLYSDPPLSPKPRACSKEKHGL
jgi:hypothetical protein